MTATGYYSDGSKQNLSSSVVWSSSNAAAATVSSAGLLSAVARGGSTITATSGVISGTDAVAVSGAWFSAGTLKDARAGHATVRLANGDVLVAGGYQGTGSGSYALSSVEIYSAATGTWSLGASLPSACSGLQMVLLQNGKVLEVCGFRANLYDPATNTWSAAANPTNYYLWGSATVLANGKALLVGEALAATETYNPTTNTWASAGSLPVKLSNFTSTLLSSGKVLVAGGNTPTGTYSIPVSQSKTVLYDPASNSWSAAASMSTPRSSHAAALLANGEVLVEGGLNLQLQGTSGQISAQLASAELYDPSTNIWLAAANMPATRYSHTSTTLADGRVLVVEGNSSSTMSSLLYDPATDAWSSAANLSAVRVRQFTATLLQNNALLVVGGFGTSVINGTEFFH